MPYCTRSDIESKYGKGNVSKWADLENDENQTDILSRINAAITWADSQINDRLRGSIYTIPITSTVPETIKDIAIRFAGFWLFEARGIENQEDETQKNRMEGQRELAITACMEIRAGVIQLDLPYVGSRIPEALTPTEET